MSKQLIRTGVPMPRGLARRNTMAFPRELRHAIPDLHTGRVLELDSINGHASHLKLFGPLVELKLVVKKNGSVGPLGNELFDDGELISPPYPVLLVVSVRYHGAR